MELAADRGAKRPVVCPTKHLGVLGCRKEMVFDNTHGIAYKVFVQQMDSEMVTIVLINGPNTRFLMAFRGQGRFLYHIAEVKTFPKLLRSYEVHRP